MTFRSFLCLFKVVAGRELCYSKPYHGLLLSKTTQWIAGTEDAYNVIMLHRGIWNMRSDHRHTVSFRFLHHLLSS